MDDLISRQTAIDAMRQYAHYDDFDASVVDEDVAVIALKDLPSVDAVKVVRCWNCVWWDNCPSSTITPNFHKCKRVGRMSMPSDGYCSCGERNETH